jgi:polysaccharide export outer membrane protein
MRKCLVHVAAAWVLCALAIVSPVLAVPPIDEKEQDASTAGDYRIGVGDVLNIQVWKEVDLTRSVPVRPDGKISFPLLDDLQAAGLTPLELEEVNSYKVYVMGQVLTQGALILKNKTDLLQVISLAGGFTPFAKRKEIIIIRNNGKSGARITVNYEKILNGKNPEQNLVLEPGDTVIVQ